MEQQSNMLSFTVNESLQMEAGQGMEEMIGISLEPDIAIETFHDYVQIRGLIILQGECMKAKENPKNKDEDRSNVTNYIEKIIDTEPNQAMFSHRFPVEISVPKNRIKNMEDVKVEVVTFDYELPTTHLLKINATLHIHGIVSDEVLSDESTNQKEERDDRVKEERQVEESLKSDEKETRIESVEKEPVYEEEKQPDTFDHTDSKQVEEPVDINTFEKEKVEDLQEENHTENVNVSEKSERTIDIQLSENEQEEEGEQVKDVLFLTDLFGDITEESVTTMRIHIIQETDTVESIAKRYDMSTLQLMKDNKLVADDMTPGKLVFIYH